MVAIFGTRRLPHLNLPVKGLTTIIFRVKWEVGRGTVPSRGESFGLTELKLFIIIAGIKRGFFMFSPGAWLQVAADFQSAHLWLNWIIFVIGLLISGWRVYADSDVDQIRWLYMLCGILLSGAVSVAWPLAIAAIPLLFALGACLLVMMMPKLVMKWLHVRKLEKAARKKLAENVDKS